MRRYEYMDHTADLGLKAYGVTLEDLFIHAAEAFSQVMVDVKTIKRRNNRLVEAYGSSLEELLVGWLNELLFLFDTEHLVFQSYHVDYMDASSLRVTAIGETFDPSRHAIKAVIKAVTYHKVFVRQEKGVWVCQVILDL